MGNSGFDKFIKKSGNKSVYLVYKPTFDDLESLLRNSKTLISCHGAPTHVASGLDIKILDIIDDSEKSLFNRFSYHFRNYNYLLPELK